MVVKYPGTLSFSPIQTKPPEQSKTANLMSVKSIKIALSALAVSMLPVFCSHAQNYSNIVANLNPAGYWPMHEVEPPAPGDIETNYGSLGLLGNGYYPDYEVNSGAFIRDMPGALANDTDTSVFFTGPA